MDYSFGIRFFAQGHRLFDHLLALEVLWGSLGMATSLVRGTLTPPPPPPPGQTYVPSFGLGGKVIDASLSIPEALALTDLVHNRKPTNIRLWIQPNVMPAHIASNPHLLSELEGATSYSLAAVFTNFYEANKDLLPGDHTKWPITDFGRVVRNAMSHRNRIYFDKPGRRAVSWRGITYAPTDNGREVLNDLWAADVIFLMMEMSEEMDDLGLPVP